MGLIMARRIFQLKITLADVRPPVWRRILIPGGYTLDRLHRAVQYAMGWQNCHLHCFEVDGVQYAEPDPDGELDDSGELATRDELDARLYAVAEKGTLIAYTYDFGDWWEHDILVEDVLPADPDERYPMCLDGEGACPPEDVGGPPGYADLLAALADPRHERHAEMTAWLGRPFDPDHFDPLPVTTLLRRLT